MKPLSNENIAYIEGNIHYIVNITETHQVHVISETQHQKGLDHANTEDTFFKIWTREIFTVHGKG